MLVGAWRDTNIVVWVGAATVDTIGRLDQALVRRRKMNPNRASTTHIVTPTASPPDSEARTALIQLNERRSAEVACAAVVIERGGLSGIAVRSAVTGIIILAPKNYRVKVFDAIEPCAPWVAEHHERATGAPLDAIGLLEVLRQARAQAL